MKQIQLTQNMVALVDDEDYALLNKYKWHVSKYSNIFYAARTIKNPDGKQTTILMHREILGLKKGDKKEADHINHSGLDNRRCNLRICSHSENLCNKTPKKDGSSPYNGVSWNTHRKKWQANIRIDGKLKFLGRFSKPEQAALTYDLAAITSFGQFANTNLF